MAVFRVERNRGYTVMSNHHLRNRDLTLKAKGLLSQMLSLPDNWDYTLAGLSHINREKIDAIREAVRELEKAGYIVRSRERDEKGRLRGADYIIYEQPQPPVSDLPTLENPTLDIAAFQPALHQSRRRIRRAAARSCALSAGRGSQHHDPQFGTADQRPAKPGNLRLPCGAGAEPAIST